MNRVPQDSKDNQEISQATSVGNNDQAMPMGACAPNESVSSKIVRQAITHSTILGYSTLDSIWSMAEPTEFYKVRDEAVPRAPASLIVYMSLLIFMGATALFIYLAIAGSKSFTIETDIFQSAQLNPSEWDSCVPTTTLGTIWSFQTLSFQDDCIKRLHFNLQVKEGQQTIILHLFYCTFFFKF
jgi:hypothetical protein